MKEKKIMLPSVEEAKHFVAEATKCDFDIDVFYNRVTIDAKSILGVLSLDLARVLTVRRIRIRNKKKSGNEHQFAFLLFLCYPKVMNFRSTDGGKHWKAV